MGQIDMKYKLNDICFFVDEKIFLCKLTKATYISTENMLPNRGGIVAASNLPLLSQTQAFKVGDVLVSNIRPYFKKIWQAEFDGGCSNDVLVFRANGGCDPTFLYYVLANDAFFDYATATSKGTKMPRGDKTAIMQYVVPDFDKDTQKRISGLLRCLDKQIATNKKINDNLQQQAQAIYASMFIDNANPTWKQGHLSDLVTVRYGKDHKKLANGIYPVYGSGGIMRHVERPLYDKESVLIPRKGTLNNVIYVNQPFWSVDTMFYTEMRLPNVAKFVYHFVKAKDLASMNAGSAVPSMTTDILNAMKVAIPPVSVLEEFESLVAPMYRAIQENDAQSKKLADLRDILLPKLMSGEIDVSGIRL